jgi:hypothetical protein
MSTAGDAERLLAAALRAQAASTGTSPNTTDDVMTPAAAAPKPGKAPDRLAAQLPIGATLLLAILLGLAAGALVGLITLL